MPRELYDLLGVPRTADGEDIRKAYLIRIRVVHPDRFNRTQQAAEWLQANDMLRELNEAYAVLSDPAKRARYDASIGQAGSERRHRSHEADTHTRADSEFSDSAPRQSAPCPDGGAVEGFLELCHYIRLTCWQQIQTGPGDRAARLLVLRAAYTDYRLRASPWLSIIMENHRGNTPVIAQVRNAAAKCLSALAGGFIGVDDLDNAQTLALEALPLVFDDERLEAEVKGQLDYVTAEKQKSAPDPGRNNREPVGEGRSSANINQKETPRPARVEGSLFDRLGEPRIGRRPVQILVVGIAVLVAILSLTKSNEPQSSALPVSPGQSLARPAPAPADFRGLTLDGQLEALQRANPQEKQQLTPIFLESLNRDIDKIPEEDQELFLRKVTAAGLPGVSRATPRPARELPVAVPPSVPGDIEAPGKGIATKTVAASPSDLDGASATAPGGQHSATAHPRTEATNTIDYAALARQAGGMPVHEATRLPSPQIHDPVSLPNGTNLIPPPAAEGLGELHINNNSSQDAVVKLKAAVGKETLRFVYVRARGV